MLKSRDHFEANPDSMPEEQRMQPMTYLQLKEQSDAIDPLKALQGDQGGEGEQDLMHVSRAAFERLRAKLEKEEDITQDDIQDMLDGSQSDKEIALDMAQTGAEEFQNLADMIEKMGTTASAEAFVGAAVMPQNDEVSKAEEEEGEEQRV